MNERDRPVKNDEIVVTQEMIEKGFSILCASGIADDLTEADKCTVSEIYYSMRQLEPDGQPFRD